MLTEQQLQFFHTFGYLKVPGLMANEIDWITDEFTQVFPMYSSKIHDGTKRTMIVPFIDQRPRLCSLLDDPRIYDICTKILGDDFNYMGSDGNYYTGNTMWHPDGNNPLRLHIKIAFYLDSLDQNSGALRVIPGSHRIGEQFNTDLRKNVFHNAHEQELGIPGDEVPAVAVDIVPGDVVVFYHNIYHSAWKGSNARRMFTLNLSERFEDEELLRKYTIIHSHYHRPSYYGKAMVETATPQRMKHLAQVLAHDHDFAERTADKPILA